MLVSRLAPTRKLVLPVRQLAGLLGRYLKFDDDFSTCGDDQLKDSNSMRIVSVLVAGLVLSSRRLLSLFGSCSTRVSWSC